MQSKKFIAAINFAWPHEHPAAKGETRWFKWDADGELQFTGKRIGKVVNDPDDPGGITAYGISLRFLRGLPLDLGDIDNDGDIDSDDIRALTEEDAAGLYLSEFFMQYGYQNIDAEPVAAKVFDLCVNMGPRQAHKIMQRALNDLGCLLVVDGVLGPKTLNAINSVAPGRLYPRICQRAKAFYLALMVRNPTLKKYRNGWFKRAEA